MNLDCDEVLRDFAGYIRWASTHDISPHTVLFTLQHDLGGLLGKRACFSPRTKGYNVYLDAPVVKAGQS